MPKQASNRIRRRVETTKFCYTCNRWHLLSDFNLDESNTTDGHMSQCRHCGERVREGRKVRKAKNIDAPKRTRSVKQEPCGCCTIIDDKKPTIVTKLTNTLKKFFK